VNNLG